MHEIVLRGRGPNTLSIESMRELSARVRGAAGEPLLLRGEGAAFSAGLDLDSLGEVHALLEAIEESASALFLHDAPTVACVNGHAVAGGCLLALCCDHRVAASDPAVRIGMTGAALGLAYPPTVLAILRYRLGNAIDRVLLGADRFDPKGALALGLVDEIADDPLAAARERLERLASHPREGYALTKRELRARAIAIDEADRKRFLEDAARAWDPEAIRARLKGR
jgi:enoyl-CoA hydratase